jgi:hypothetical protein
MYKKCLVTLIQRITVIKTNLLAGTGNSSILRGKHTAFAMPRWEKTVCSPRKCYTLCSSQISFHFSLGLELGKKTELFTVYTNSRHFI